VFLSNKGSAWNPLAQRMRLAALARRPFRPINEAALQDWLRSAQAFTDQF